VKNVLPHEQLEDEQLFHVIELTPSSQIRARRYTWDGQTRYDLRWFALRKRDGQWVATQRGISTPPEKLPDLLEAVQELLEAAAE
jgi:hypothetical protein